MSVKGEGTGMKSQRGKWGRNRLSGCTSPILEMFKSILEKRYSLLEFSSFYVIVRARSTKTSLND